MQLAVIAILSAAVLCTGAVDVDDNYLDLDSIPELAKFRPLIDRIRGENGHVPKAEKAELPKAEKAAVAKAEKAVEPVITSLDHEAKSVPSCSGAIYQQCAQAYANAIGIPFPLPSSAQTYFNLINQIYANQGETGFLMVCRAGIALQQCMGVNFNNCFGNQINMVNVLGLNPANAAQYTTLLYSHLWQCGPGSNIYVNNWNCIWSTVVNDNSTIQSCVNGLLNNLLQNPSRMCSYFQAFANCYAIPFHLNCGGAVAYGTCEQARVGFMWAYPQCINILCPSLQQVVESKNGKHPFLVDKN